MKKIVQLIDKVLMNHDNEKVILKVRDEVNLFMEKFPLY
jgi:glycine hydroxymethyltransferase